MQVERIIGYTDLQGREVTDCRSPGEPEVFPELVLVKEKPAVSYNPRISPEDLEKIFPLICTKETTFPKAKKTWIEENPLHGQCTAVALVAQDLLGGDLIRASLENNPDFKYMRFHYWNRLPDGREVDFTKAQFQDKYPKGLTGEVRKRKEILRIKNVEERYKLLSLRLAKYLNNNNPIFDNPIYQLCFSNALDSKCQKMKFGCVITHNGKVVYKGHNETSELLKQLCDPKCIRFLIQSRTEQMLGACGHAEELGLWELAKKKEIPLNECELYVAGVYPDGLPWLKKEAEHTCLRCANQMYNAGIKKVYVPVIDKWIGLTKEEALRTALVYATKEKAV